MENNWEYKINLSKKGIFDRVIELGNDRKNCMTMVHPFNGKINDIVMYAVRDNGFRMAISAVKEKISSKEYNEVVTIAGTNYNNDKPKLEELIKLLE